MTSPLNTDVMANDTPVTVPTRPFALSRRSSGTSSVTHVDMAMPRMWPATEPSSVNPVSTQNSGLRSCSRSPDGTARNTTVAAAKEIVVIVVASTIDGCLRWRSTYVPNAGPRMAAEMLKAPPMTPVTTTERVSRYTQNVSANQRNELVTPLTSELTRRRRNVRSSPSEAATWRRSGASCSIAPIDLSSTNIAPSPHALDRRGMRRPARAGLIATW